MYVHSNNKGVLFLLCFSSNSPFPFYQTRNSTFCIMFLPLMHLRLLLLLVATIAFASPLLAPEAEFFGQGSIGPGAENFPALDGDVYDYQHGSADGALLTSTRITTSNYLDTSATVKLGSTLIGQIEDEIPKDQFQKFKNTKCAGEDSVCCMGDRTYFSSGEGGTAWPCSMSNIHPSPSHTFPYIHTIMYSILFLLTHLPVIFFVLCVCIEQYVRGAGNENVAWFIDSRWTNYCHAPKHFSTCEELKVSGVFPKKKKKKKKGTRSMLSEKRTKLYVEEDIYIYMFLLLLL